MVRVRIAPSPTGVPHVGTAYIALFNYLFARANNGEFILRIEDTDKNRSLPIYEKAIMDSLRWLNLTWDEGPDIGGKYPPYRQSERTELYQQYAEKLIAKDGAYRCFCTPERLAKMREEQIERKLTPKYDGKCRTMAETAISKKLKDEVPFVVRLKVPKRGKCIVKDRLRKDIAYDYKEIDDQILLKSDGFPTYHLANVVDDYLMKITHVIRGEEWLVSTPKHVLLYEFLGWEKPEFIHMPLLLNPDGTKLSKRKNPTSITYYKDSGYLPEALINFLSLLSYSHPEEKEKFPVKEMIKLFDIDRISLGGSIFDLKKLNWLNGKYIRENHTPELLYRRLGNWKLNNQFLSKVVPLMMQRMETLGDFIPKCSFFWATTLEYDDDLLLLKKRDNADIVKVLQSLLFEYEKSTKWTAEAIEEKIRYIANLWQWKIREITGVLFVAITGSKVAPPLFSSMELLGQNICQYRIMQAIEKLGGLSKKKLSNLEKELRRLKAEFDAKQQQQPQA